MIKKTKIILKRHREKFPFRSKENVSALTFVFLRTTIRKVTARIHNACLLLPMFILFLIGNLFSVFSQIHVYLPAFHYYFIYTFKTHA